MFKEVKAFIKSKDKRILLAIYAAPALAAMSIVLITVPMIQNGMRGQGITSAANSSADIVVGQETMTENTANQSLYGKTLYFSNGVYSDGTRLFVADTYNHRVLIYNTIPTSNGASADVVIGQADMTSGSANRGGSAGANTLYYPSDVYSDGTRLFVADRKNNRVLIYNTIPTSNGASADVVIGQANMTSNTANRGGDVGANTLYYPMGVYSNGTRLFVTDHYNHRVLIYNTIPTSNGASADVVIGQADRKSVV